MLNEIRMVGTDWEEARGDILGLALLFILEECGLQGCVHLSKLTELHSSLYGKATSKTVTDSSTLFTLRGGGPTAPPLECGTARDGQRWPHNRRALGLPPSIWHRGEDPREGSVGLGPGSGSCLPAPSPCASSAVSGCPLGRGHHCPYCTPAIRHGEPGGVAATGGPRAEEGRPALKLTTMEGRQRASV